MTGAGLAAAALIGCGSDEDEPTATASATGDGGTATGTGTEAVSAGKPGGRLQLTQAGDPPSFDLHRESTTYTAYSTSMGYNQLIRMDPAVGEETPESVIGDLATEWEISPDGLTYTFNLVQNAKYHDGTPFTAADVKASYERQINPPEALGKPPRGGQLKVIESIDTPDDYTLVLNLARPASSLSLLPILAQGWMAIYSQKDVEGGFDFRQNVNGTGAYKLNSYEQGSKVVWDKNPDYHVAERPYLDGVDLYIIPDTSTALANFQGGQLNVYSPTKKDLESLTASLGDKIVTQPTKGYGFNTINFGGRDPWTDVRVREAVAMAMNKQSAIDVLAFGDGRLGGYLSGEGYWSLSAEEMTAIPGYAAWDESLITEARKMLDAAGVPATMDSTILTRQGSSFEAFSLYVQDQLAKLGINAALDIQETASAYEIMSKLDFDLAPWNHAYAVDDPDAVFAEFYITGAPRNYSQVSSPEVDDMYLAQSQEQDPETRRQMVKDLQLTAMPLYGKILTNWTNARESHWATVKNYTSHTSIYNNRRWQDVWLDA